MVTATYFGIEGGAVPAGPLDSSMFVALVVLRAVTVVRNVRADRTVDWSMRLT